MNTYFNDFLPLETDDELQMDKQLAAFFHDKRGGYIKYASGCIGYDEQIQMKQYTAKNENDVCFFSPEEFFCRKHCFVSLATFQRKEGARSAFNIFNRSIMYIDIDCHKDNVDCEAELINVAAALTDAYNKNELPIPTMINHTGRGLAIYYILEHSINEALPELKKTRLAFDSIYKRLIKKYQSVLRAADITDANVDTAVTDKARLVRVAGTENPNNGKICHTIFRNEDGFGHMTYISSLDDIGRYVRVKKLTPKRKKRRQLYPTSNINEVLKDRVDILRSLILLRKNEKGTRHMTLFVAFQTLAVLYRKEDAALLLDNMNHLYKNPLPQRELDKIIKTYRKPFSYTNKKMIEILGITDEEKKKIGLKESNVRKLERAKKKEENKKKREVRNDAIFDMIATGLYTYAQIAEKFGVSVALIKKLVHDGKQTEAKTALRKVYPSRKDIISCYMNNKKRRIKRAFSFWKQGIIFCHLYICAMSYRSVAMVRPSSTIGVGAMRCSLSAPLGDMRKHVGAMWYACSASVSPSRTEGVGALSYIGFADVRPSHDTKYQRYPKEVSSSRTEGISGW